MVPRPDAWPRGIGALGAGGGCCGLRGALTLRRNADGKKAESKFVFTLDVIMCIYIYDICV